MRNAELWILNPPSMNKLWPLIYLASSLAKKRAALATSSTLRVTPLRFASVFIVFSKSSSLSPTNFVASGVAIAYGDRQFTPTAGRDHDTRRVFHAEEDSGDVDAEHALEVGLGVVDDAGFVGVRDPRVGEHDVELSEGFDCLVDGASDVFLVRHVAVEIGGVGGPADGLHDGAAEIFLDVGDGDFGAVLCKELRRAFSDAAGSSRYQCNLPF
nr:hypothetical protein Iba_chr14cCG6410 [Ipomoea batatas]